jgi:hypothetical protein
MARRLGGGAGWALAVGLVLAGSAVAAAEEVRVCVIAIIATERNKEVDPKLTCIAEQVQKTHPKLTGFSFKELGCKSMAVGERKEFKLPGNEVAAVTVLEPTGKDKPYRIRLEPPQMKPITYETCCTKFLAIRTPVRTKDNDLLLIAVRVTPCKGK